MLHPPLSSLLESGPILEWPAELYRYQVDGVIALTEHDALLLADDMGLGKTIQAIAALRVLVYRGRVDKALVVAPAGLLSQWRHELEHWASELQVTVVRGSQATRRRLWSNGSQVHVVSYESLRQDVEAGDANGPREIEWDVVILDEAQKIKNVRTRAARACKELHRRASWALTGTPLENDLDELASIVQFLSPVGDPVQHRLLQRGAELLSHFVTPLPPRRRQPPLLHGDDLLSAHGELQMRRRKIDVLDDLPAKSVYDVWLQFDDRQRESYERAEREGVVRLQQLGHRVTVPNVLALIQHLKQICNVCPETGSSVKLDDLAERAEEIASTGDRSLVFSQYVSDEFGVGGIVRRLGALSPLAFHGGLSSREKDGVLAEFRASSDHKVLVLSLRAGGQGLNLQEASYVFHFDRWWNPAVERQAEDRAHRLGQKNAVTVYRYICEDTIEERIDRILREKQHLFDEYVDQVTIDPGRLLGEREIFGLFGLEPPSRGGGTAVEELEG